MAHRALKIGLGVLAIAAFVGAFVSVRDASIPTTSAPTRPLALSEGRDDSTIVVAAPDPVPAPTAPAKRPPRHTRRSSRHAPVLAPLPTLPASRMAADMATSSTDAPPPAFAIHNASVVPRL